MKKRPLIWIVIAYVSFVAGLLTLVTIAVRNTPEQVPVTHGR